LKQDPEAWGRAEINHVVVTRGPLRTGSGLFRGRSNNRRILRNAHLPGREADLAVGRVFTREALSKLKDAALLIGRGIGHKSLARAKLTNRSMRLVSNLYNRKLRGGHPRNRK